MSAAVWELPQLAVMREADLDEVLAIEQAVYTHPWTHGNFSDSLRAGYVCRTWRVGGILLGYFVLLVAAGEAHLLNLSVAARAQRRGHGSALLAEAERLARTQDARHVFLEVRPSNDAALALYARAGYQRVAVRRGYYPAHTGREDAIVMTRAL